MTRSPLAPGHGTIRIAGSLWSVADAEIDDAAAHLCDSGLEVLHWDTTDGVFARPGGFAPRRAAAVTAATGLRAEAHLMVADPIRHVDAWTDFCEVVAVHVEAPGWEAAVERIAARGSRPALAVSPGSVIGHPVAAGLGVLVMTVRPGHGGERFSTAALETVLALRGRPLLGVDGGVTPATAAAARAHGATWIVSGTDLLAATDPRRWLADTRGREVRANGTSREAPGTSTG
jgi:ribulose-phosphate 3-epimerase